MNNGQLENAGMEIRELLQSFCAESLPECLDSIRIFQNSSNVYVKYYWKHKTTLGEVLESETVASLSDFLDEDGSPMFSLGASIVKNALVFCSDLYLQESISERIFPIDTKDIVEFDKTLIDDKNISVKLLSINKMLMAESKLIIHFYLENKTDSDIRVWLKNVKAIYDLNNALCDCYDIGDGPYSSICELGKNEHRKCSTVLVDKGFCNCDPFADIAAGKSENCLSFQIAYDFWKDDDYDATHPLCFDNYMNDCWFEGDQGTGNNTAPPTSPQTPPTSSPQTPPSTSPPAQRRVLNYNDILVRITALRADQLEKHNVIEKVNNVWINVLRHEDLKQIEKLVPKCYYCEKGFFLILDSDYRSLTGIGVLMCRIVPQELFTQVQNGATVFGLEPESLLHQYGYNVKKGDLTELERHTILETVIDEEAYTPTGLLSFIGWLIDKHRFSPSMADAIKKWQSDRDYVKAYTLSLGLPVAIENPEKEMGRELNKLTEEIKKLRNRW